MKKTFADFQALRQTISKEEYEKKYGVCDIPSPFVMDYNGFYIQHDTSCKKIFQLTIGRSDYESNNLETLEAILFSYAIDEGFLDDEPKYLSGKELDLKIERVVEVVCAIFWDNIAEEFPEITTGDLDPDTAVDLHDRMESAVKTWYQDNQELKQ